MNKSNTTVIDTDILSKPYCLCFDTNKLSKPYCLCFDINILSKPYCLCFDTNILPKPYCLCHKIRIPNFLTGAHSRGLALHRWMHRYGARQERSAMTAKHKSYRPGENK